MLSSVKTIAQGFNISKERATAIRKALELSKIHSVRFTLETVDEIMGGFGVEYIPKGEGYRSPAITYVNMGDTYSTTILYVKNSFRVGCWGDIVERGSYA